MATARQVTNTAMCNAMLVVLLTSYVVISSEEYHVWVPDNAPPGYIVTDTVCEADLHPRPESQAEDLFYRLFHIDHIGTISVKANLKSATKHTVRLHVDTYHSVTSRCNLPFQTNISIEVVPSDKFIRFTLSQYKGDIVGTSLRRFDKDIPLVFHQNIGTHDIDFHLQGKHAEKFQLLYSKTNNSVRILQLEEIHRAKPFTLYFTLVARDVSRGMMGSTNIIMTIPVKHDKTSNRLVSKAVKYAKGLKNSLGHADLLDDVLRFIPAKTSDIQNANKVFDNLIGKFRKSTEHLQERKKRGAFTRNKRQVATATVSVDVAENKGENEVLYTITRQQSGTTFELKSEEPNNTVVVSANGDITLRSGSKLDYDRGAKSIRVKANEKSGTTVVTEHIVTINVLDVNDEAPEISNIPIPLQAKAEPWTKAGEIVYQLSATDLDLDSNITFHMQGMDEYYMVDQFTGAVKTKKNLQQNLDRTILVYAQDVAASSEQNSVKVNLLITTKDLKPQFYLNKYEAEISENAQVNQIFSFKTEPKVLNFQNGTNTFVIINPNTLQPTSSLFELTTVDGVLKVKALRQYDHEEKAQYNLFLKVTDSVSQLSNTVELVITILDVNEAVPVFSISTYYTRGVSEASNVGATVSQVRATDKDTSSTITYSLTDENFDIKSENNMGYIIVKSPLDYETHHRYTMIVEARDDGGTTKNFRSSTATVIIEVKNANDNKPVFTSDSMKQTVPDDMDDSTSSVKLVLQVHATDEDHGDGITYAFGNGEVRHEIFDINPTTGVINLQNTVGIIPNDVNKYDFTVIAKDDGGCCTDDRTRNTGMASVTIYIVDAVNTKPRFDCRFTATVKELQGPNAFVKKVVAVDDSRGEYGVVDYMLQDTKGFNAVDFLQINASTGEIRTKKDLRREDPALQRENLFITVIGTDRGRPPLSDQCTFRLIVEDVNNHEPTFTAIEYATSIRNTTQPNDVVFSVLATDADYGINAEIEYSLTVNPDNLFRIERDTGAVLLDKSFASSSPQQFSLTITATDKGSPPLSGTVTLVINVRDQLPSPSWQQSSYQFTVSEIYTQADTIGTFNLESNIANTPVSPQALFGGDMFELPKIDGSISEFALKLRYGKLFTYERQRRYSLLMRASNQLEDATNSYRTAIVNLLDANVQKPEFVGIPSENKDNFIPVSVLENEKINTLVGNVLALDGDIYTPAFSTVNYEGNNGIFTIDSLTGAIRTNRSFDAEEKSVYFLELKVSDGAPSDVPGTKGNNTGTATVSITISDVNDHVPQFSPPYDFSIAEDAVINAKVGMVTATDKDSGHDFRYVIEDASNSNLQIPFFANWTDGSIYVSHILDYETKSQYNLNMIVFDGKYKNQTPVTIRVTEVNDVAPFFTQELYEFATVNEGDYTSNERKIGQVSATDGDKDRTTDFKYSILTTQFDTVINSVFRIDEKTGDIYVKGVLDRDPPDGQEVFSFAVSVEDEPGNTPSLKGYAVVNVRPTDENDNSPQFDTSSLLGKVNEGQVDSVVFMTVTATDRDAGLNGQVVYTYVADSQSPVVPSNAFTVQDGGGILKAVAIDREEVDKFTIVIRATDRAVTDPKHTDGTATIYVIDINDNNPVFNRTLMSVTMKETFIGNIFAVHAYDLDVNDILSYEVTPQFFKYFGMDKNGDDAFLHVHNSPDFDIGETFFNVTVMVTDGTNSAFAYVAVTVTDVNDNAPEFLYVNVSNGGNFSEAAAVGTLIAEFEAKDIDSGRNKDFNFYVLLESNPYKNFIAESTSPTKGRIVLARSLDRETIPVFDLKLLAIDQGMPQQTATYPIRINVMDVNDSPPRLKENIAYVAENKLPYTFHRIFAEDPDLPENGPPFRILALPCDQNIPPTCNEFEFSSMKGQGADTQYMDVSTKMILNREPNNEYRARIQLVDNADNTGTSTLTIIVQDDNDSDNKNSVQYISVYNYKGMFSNVGIGLAGFSDADGPDRDTKTFKLISKDNHIKNFFRVDAKGQITMLEKVAYAQHKLEISVTDSGVIDPKTRAPKPEVVSITTVYVTVTELAEEAPYNTGSIRLTGTTASEFVTPTGNENLSPYERLRAQLAKDLGKDAKKIEEVQIVSINDTNKDFLDIRFAAHGSPYYSSARMNSLVEKNKDTYETLSGGKIAMVNIDECLKESCEGGCYNEIVVNPQPIVVNSLQASKVGVDTYVQAKCGCRTPVSGTECSPDYCFNGGKCVKNRWGSLRCQCESNFEGPRCQKTKLGFTGVGYALFKPLEQCKEWITSIEFATENKVGLIFYSGPMEEQEVTDPEDFIALQLENGFPKLLINLGTGTLELSVTGSDLSDGKYHQIDIVKQGKYITLVVDKCKAATSSPDSGGTSDRSNCEASGFTPSTHEYLNVNAFLQLGGRMNEPKDSNNNILPAGVTSANFKGCMRNLRHKGELYDLYTGGKFTGVTDSCPEEDNICSASVNTQECGSHGQCVVTDISETSPKYTCVCDIGYRNTKSAKCSTATTIRDFESESYMDWSLVNAFKNTLNNKETSFHLSFRTRDKYGVVFHLSSDSSDFIRLQIEDGILQLSYDLGDGQQLLAMNNVDASDGQWHNVHIQRVGRFFEMTMDNGEGPRYVTSLGQVGGFEEMSILGNQIYAGAEVAYSSSSSSSYSANDFKSSCYNDIRLDVAWFPMTGGENNENDNVKLVDAVNVDDELNCDRVDCTRDRIILCANQGKVCLPLWEAYTCVCGPGKEEIDGSCRDIDHCRDNPCYQGTCKNETNGFFCDCPKGWFGIYCSQQAFIPQSPDEPVNNAGMLAGIIVGVVLLLIIAFIVGFLIYRHCGNTDEDKNLIPDDKEDYEIRENIVAYDEEGAGEEDHEGYDLNRLRMPVDKPMTRMDHPTLNRENDMRQNRPDLGGPGGPGINDFISDRLGDADDDPNAPPYDTVMDLNYEGEGSDAGSLSSLNTTSSGGSQDYDYLKNWGPKFARLADMYNQYDEYE